MNRLVVCLLVVSALSVAVSQTRVTPGDEVFLREDIGMIMGKKVGLITNRSGELQSGIHIADTLAKIPGVKLAALFGPEHGIRGKAGAGATVSDSVDVETGVPLYSLYGSTRKPTSRMLAGIDVLIYDIQDAGTRFYTYISTLQLCLEAAAENHIRFIVLDKPDLLSGDLVDGPVLNDSLESFVGMQPIPSVYGMTPGEYATMINESGMLTGRLKADLTVVKMKNYERKMWYDQTGLKWIDPSPNIPDMKSAVDYPATVLLEATNVSEGRGTQHPFVNIGAPFIDPDSLVTLLDGQRLPGVKFEPVEFTPRSYPWAVHPKFEGQLCRGVNVVVADRDVFKPVETGVTLLWALHKLYPESLKIRGSGLDRLAGDASVRTMIDAGKTPAEIEKSWRSHLNRFLLLRDKFLLYR